MKINTVPLVGYADPLSGRPGDTISFKVSSSLPGDYHANLVRVISADPNPAGPGIQQRPVVSDLEGDYPCRDQPFWPGSYGKAELPADTLGDCFSLVANILPTHINGEFQVILELVNAEGRNSLGIALDGNGHLVFFTEKGDGIEVEARSDQALTKHRWYRVWSAWDHERKQGSLGYDAIQMNTLTAGEKQPLSCDFEVSGHNTVNIAAHCTPDPCYHFNGKIECPAIFSAPIEPAHLPRFLDGAESKLVSLWDFSIGISTTRITDIGPASAHGRLFNLPTRAMMGSNWTSKERNWNHCPGEYSAIHFHEDDLYDVGWETSFEFTIPESLESGVYAVNIESGEHRDNIPFFVLPPRGARTSPLCVLVSTFTYVVYGNHARPDFDPSWIELSSAKQGYPWNPAQYPGYGLSTYNIHSDGSGICHASHQRPLFTLKSGYITFPTSDCSGLRHFQADTHLFAWLDHMGIDYDIVTDQQLNNEGMDAIRGYSTLCTGSHPEYHTPAMLDALSNYRKDGGNLVYLGGNGFYWKIAEHPESPGTLEVRRAEGGIRAWAAEPGEYYHAFDGGYGGLWRRNNRPPQRLAGIGFSAQGIFTGSFYRRTPASYDDPEVSWMFEGIDDDCIGGFGLSGNGAAGFELDRVDPALGSDPNTIVVARSEGHDESFVLVPEEQLTHLTNLPGESAENLIRADMVYQKSGNGSQLFATGSITFCGSLMFNGGVNNISTLLTNVLRRFTD